MGVDVFKAEMNNLHLIPFELVGYDFDENSLRARFRYRGGPAKNPLNFEEIVDFSDRAENYNKDILDRALRLAFIVIGTSYYKAFPTRKAAGISFNGPDGADFPDAIYQDGLSQFAYENNLKREDLAHFDGMYAYVDKIMPAPYTGSGKLVLQSGGKDSLLTATLLNETNATWTALYISSSDHYPKVLDELGADKLQIIKRTIDHENLAKAKALGGLNGHVPVTYINVALAIVQAVLNNQNEIITSIGHEGEEPHAVIKSQNNEQDLVVNHQWSKTATAEKLLQHYITENISDNIKVHSLLRKYSELKIAELFAEKCWPSFGHKFSSCNQANYGQGTNNDKLKWCGHCAKCANSYLLFAPFLESTELNSIFADEKSLFEKPVLYDDFKGLLGIDNKLKPFECVGEIAELRKAYHMKKPSYPDLPFSVPDSDFDYNKLY